jgi:FtsH-binding integral membrane protein
MFTSSPFIQNLYCCIGVILFGFYLIIDTQMILGGKTVEIAVDEYFLAAMLLYIDIIQIFLYILQLLGNKD